MAEISLICEENLLDTIFFACDTQRRGTDTRSLAGLGIAAGRTALLVPGHKPSVDSVLRCVCVCERESEREAVVEGLWEE